MRAANTLKVYSLIHSLNSVLLCEEGASIKPCELHSALNCQFNIKLLICHNNVLLRKDNFIKKCGGYDKLLMH